MAALKGFVYDTETRTDPGNVEPALTDYANYVDKGSVESGYYFHNLDGLTENTEYFYRAYAYNETSEEWEYGEEQTFTTLELTVPVLGNLIISNIEYEQVTAQSSIALTGGSAITERGFVYGESPNPDVDNDTKVISDAAFIETITGLDGNVTYYIRAYAINDTGVGYSDEETFVTTEYQVPTLGVLLVSNVGYKTADLESSVEDDGGKPVTEYGFVYATHENPTIDDEKVIMGGGL